MKGIRNFVVGAVVSMAAAVTAAEEPISLSMSKEQFKHIEDLAKRVLSPKMMEVVNDPNKYQGFEKGLSIFEDHPHTDNRRRLGATDEECGIFLAASLSAHMWDCYNMFQTMLNLVTTENCKTKYDFSQSNMQRICSNPCYDGMVKALNTMSQAGCSASVLKQTCNECATNEKCVEGKCRTICNADLTCTCDEQCTDGACIPPKNGEVTMNDLGMNGYKVSMEYICTTAPNTNEYCFSKIFNVLNNVVASSFCDDLAPVGCCTGTVFSYVTECATTNSTISTNIGTVSLTDLADFCPQIDFKTLCSTAPPLIPGSCGSSYFLSGAWPSARTSIVMTLLTAAGVLAGLYL